MFVPSVFVPSFRTRRHTVMVGLNSGEIIAPDPHRVTLIFSADMSAVFCLDIEEQSADNRCVIVVWGPGDRVVDWSTYGVLTTLRWWGRTEGVPNNLNITEILFEPQSSSP